MSRPKNDTPPAPKLYGDGRGGERWLTYWTDDAGRPASKTFGPGTLNKRQAEQRYRHWLENEWKAKPHVRNPRSAVAAYTVFRMSREYLMWARRNYRKNGKPTSHVRNMIYALRGLCDMYGTELAAEFDAPKLAAFREELIRGGKKGGPRAVSTVNDRLSIVRHCFAWARELGRVPAVVTNDIATVRRASSKRSAAKPKRKISEVDRETVDATKAKMSPHLADLIELMWLTGMRPGEAVDLRGCEVEKTPAGYFYVPGSWKSQHHTHLTRRAIPFGPRAMAIFRRNVGSDLSAVVFSPRRVHVEIFGMRAFKWADTNAKGSRKGVVQDRFSVGGLRNHIDYACRRAGIPKWSPNRLRHATANRVRDGFGEEGAKAVLGHTTKATTQFYLDPNMQFAAKIAAEVG